MEKKHEKLPYGQRTELKISGDVPQEKKDSILQMHAEIFQGDHRKNIYAPEKWDMLAEATFEKGPEEREFIAEANGAINEALRACGVATTFDFPEENIYFVTEEFYNKNFNPNFAGTYFPDVQKIVVRGHAMQNFVDKMLVVTHELIHAKEAIAAHAVDERVYFQKRGVTTRLPQGNKAEDRTQIVEKGIGLNEALVARLEKKIFKKLFHESAIFETARQLMDDRKDEANDLAQRLGRDPDDMYLHKPFLEKTIIFSHSYPDPRKALDYILTTVSSAMSVPIEEVENVLYGIHFTGDLALRAQAKIAIEKTFGKGAFQEIMAMQPEPDSTKETIASLEKRRLEIIQKQFIMKEKKPTIKTPAADSPYEVLLSPEVLARKRAKQAELTRTEVVEQSQEVEQPLVEAATEESMEETKNETIVHEQTVADAESFTPEEKKMTATETREAREREEEGIAALAHNLFEKRMQGQGAEMVDAILVENGITPWTPEAEAFMKQWDWDQATAALAPIEQNRQEAIEQVNGIEPKEHIELSEKEEGVIAVQLAQFNMQPADLEQISGFDALSYGQRLLVVENLRQATLGRIQEEATDKHRQEVANSAWYGKIWRNAFSKLRIAKHEKETAQEIMQGGLEHHREVLAQLTVGAENMGLDVLVEKDGSLAIQYLGKNELLSPAEQEQVAKFNTAAQKFSTIPAEWSFAPEGSKEHAAYKKAFQEFDQFKRTLLATEGNIFGEKNAMYAMSNAEFKMRSNQFFNTHPDAMKELVAIKSDAIWTRGLGDMFKERGAQTSLGYIGRAMGASLLGKAAAMPIVGGVIGMFMARKRAKESLHTQERQMRSGKNVDARFADMMYTTVPATTLGEKLERALRAVSTSEQNPEQHKKALATLRARLEYSQFKLEEGRIDFGSREVHTGNQYDLFDKIGAGFALLEQTAITDELESEEKAGKRFNRLDKMFAAEQDEVEDLRRIYKNKEMLKGMAVGATFSIVGYLIADTFAETGNAHAATAPENVSAVKKSIDITGEAGSRTAHVNGVSAVGKVAALSAAGEQAGSGVASAAAAEAAPLQFVEGGDIAATQETIPTVTPIGARGTEGSIIDALKTNPELAKKFGWDGVTDIKEWSGKEAHALWLADAKEQLAKPEMIAKLKNAGYALNAKGYAEAMQHIVSGSVEIDPTAKTINLENIEFAKARVTVAPPVVPVEQPVAAPQIVGGHAPEVAPQIVSGSEPAAVAEAVAPQIVGGHEVGNVTESVKDVLPTKPDILTEGHGGLWKTYGDMAFARSLEQQFGLEGAEYSAIKKVTVGDLLEQIPSSDEAWAMYRGVGEKTVNLPHSGIYGPIEFKKHVDLAEYIRNAHPDKLELRMSVDAFMKEHLTGPVTAADVATAESQNVSGLKSIDTVNPAAPQVVGGSNAEIAPSAAAEVEPVKTEAVISAPAIEEVAAVVKPPVVTPEAAAAPISEILNSPATIINPERLALLEENIYTNRTTAIPHIIDHYNAGDITARDFTAYYAGMVDGVRNDGQTVAHIQQLFQDAATGSSVEIKSRAIGELTKIVAQLQKLK